MKRTNINAIAISIFLAFFAFSSFGQPGATDTTQTPKKHPKIDKAKVPKEVTETFYLDYPGTTFADWYDYPAFDFVNDWYDYEPFWYSENPDNYVVDFNTDNTPYKAVYSKAGKKIATHKTLKTDLPGAVSASIKNGEYKSWKLAKDKEEIFKDKDTDQLKVYKVTLEKGKEKHILYIQQDGQLLKDKKIS